MASDTSHDQMKNNYKATDVDLMKVGEPLCKDYRITPLACTIIFSIQFLIYFLTFLNYFRKM